MLYAIYALDVPDSGPRRAASRPAHLERVKAMHAEGRIAMVGPLPKLDAASVEGGIAGSLIIAEFDSLEAAKELQIGTVNQSINSSAAARSFSLAIASLRTRA